MNLMWRSTHEALIAEKNARIAELRQEKRVLLQAMVRMKLTGAVLTPKAKPGLQPEADPIGVAIERAADGDSALARHYRKMAAAELKKGTPADDIVTRILNGPPAGDGD